MADGGGGTTHRGGVFGITQNKTFMVNGVLRYVICAVKYFIAFCVLFVAITWLSMLAQPIEGYTVWDVIEATLRSDRGMWLMVAAVVLAASYPRFGFLTRKMEGFIEEDRAEVEKAFALTGYRLESEEDGVMHFRAESVVKRFLALFEDEITVSQYGQWIIIKGNRRQAARVIYRLEMLLSQKRAGVEE